MLVLAATRLPSVTSLRPILPAIGERISVYSRLRRASASCERAPFRSACAVRKFWRRCSASCSVPDPVRRNCSARSTSACANSTRACALVSVACACSMASRYGRWSIVNRRSPALIMAPSVKCTRSRYPCTRARISTDPTASKRPMKSSVSWISLTTGLATVTGGGGAFGPPCADAMPAEPSHPPIAATSTSASEARRRAVGAGGDTTIMILCSGQEAMNRCDDDRSLADRDVFLGVIGRSVPRTLN